MTVQERTQPTEYLTLKEAAARFKVSEKTLRRRISTGDLRAVHNGRRLIRIAEADLEALFEPVPNARSLAS
ncbi:MAG: helix-turn-helix domain-containing protein [Propionibacteriaceae bacterium]|nr:helix-turn-helix domain-containing protein [Propionibacteriaceae bacterium]